MKYPHEFYPHFPYGFTPWQMGYPIPPPYYPLPGHGRYGETPGDAAGSSSSTELKIEPSRAETLSSSATPPNEPQIEDLIVSEQDYPGCGRRGIDRTQNENAGEIIEDVKTVDPAKTINV